MGLVREGWVSLIGFSIGSSIILFRLLSQSQSPTAISLIFLAHLIGSSLLIPTVLSLPAFPRVILQIGTFLGWSFSLGLSLLPIAPCFGTYLIFLSLFHYSEFLVTAISNPKNLSKDSYLINHGKEYGLALLLSWVEYFTEHYCFGKTFGVLSGLGVLLCLLGDGIRKTAMLQAGASFNHIVQSDRKGDHILITEGLYSLSRHPSYVGWFIWSAGTQVILLNPICFVVYVLVTWSFFNERIYYEEYTLLNLFGEPYRKYMERVPVGIPFIKGYPSKTT
eukprot:TRINITY_DN6727_c0_g1_i1.p1 TRINITY_DN6727_c0_g1~~TRINITY_DN6727_c0_g1_i1.p1  ORF type:complete len:278 (+),score=45.81 TRINITY_DN6727_c0_g1_i1:39-872(+)